MQTQSAHRIYNWIHFKLFPKFNEAIEGEKNEECLVFFTQCLTVIFENQLILGNNYWFVSAKPVKYCLMLVNISLTYECANW